MSAKVKLSAITDALEIQLEEVSQYLDRRTGTVVGISGEAARLAEDEDGDLDDLDDWEREQAEIARRIDAGDENYLPLPTKFDVHEWDMMRQFCGTVENAEIEDDLLNAIHGTGAFRMFKDAIHRRGVADQWYRYRQDALRQIAVEWCDEHGIEYEDDVSARGRTE